MPTRVLPVICDLKVSQGKVRDERSGTKESQNQNRSSNECKTSPLLSHIKSESPHAKPNWHQSHAIDLRRMPQYRYSPTVVGYDMLLLAFKTPFPKFTAPCLARMRLMETYDIIMLVVIVGATLFGAIKGFAWQLASIASIVISYIVAYKYREPISESIQADPPWDRFLAMLILYIGTSLAHLGSLSGWFAAVSTA